MEKMGLGRHNSFRREHRLHFLQSGPALTSFPSPQRGPGASAPTCSLPLWFSPLKELGPGRSNNDLKLTT